MNERPKRTSASRTSSYYEPKSDGEFEDPISSDDQFADPMYEVDNDTASSSTFEPPKKKTKASKEGLLNLEKKILDEVMDSLKKKNSAYNRFNKRVESQCLQQQDTYILNKHDLEKAIAEVKSKGKRNNILDKGGHARKMKILDLCSRDPKLRTRNTNGVCLSRTQQLLYHLNRSVLKHDWSAVATIIDYMMDLNGKLLPVIWKSVFLVLFNHPESNSEKISKFLQMCIGLRTEEDKFNYLQELVTLPEDLAIYGKPLEKKSDDMSQTSVYIDEENYDSH